MTCVNRTIHRYYLERFSCGSSSTTPGPPKFPQSPDINIHVSCLSPVIHPLHSFRTYEYFRRHGRSSPKEKFWGFSVNFTRPPLILPAMG
ncbi:hypothetical protein OUZ56_014087 [Daphnia magna]|uniref:Uncharacterized protein n=1 Tax=Daphnia magna TaxID=35525 RepID=A0ABQ9Z7U4_9CRUS|nr:hypothetical protein OUZ56_014087 [Daphnia magna]